ncbi:MAG: dGTP triphosphohydrolase [Dehalobacterium sp.]
MVQDYCYDHSILRPSQNKNMREIPSDPTHPFRTEFMRDRDRIMFSKAFRRLGGKTQIFLANYNDHARNRLTHSLEVAKIARTIARFFNFDVDLAEAIALGHDLGHPPFGHSGEEALSMIMSGCLAVNGKKFFHKGANGFKHNFQSVRVAVDLERSLKNKRGLNLTRFTLFGLANHTQSIYKKCNIKHNFTDSQGIKEQKDLNFCKITKDCSNQFQQYQKDTSFYDRYNDKMKFKQTENFCWSFEAFIVRLADEIAQREHDIEDALEMGIMTIDEVIEVISELFEDIVNKNKTNKENFDRIIRDRKQYEIISDINRFIFNLYIWDLTENSAKELLKFLENDITYYNWKDKYPEISDQDVKHVISFSDEFFLADRKFKNFMEERIIRSFAVQRMDGIGIYIIKNLFEAYLGDPQQMPDKSIVLLYKCCVPEDVDVLFESEKKKNREKSIEFYKYSYKSKGFPDFDEIEDRIIPDFEIADSQIIPRIVGELRNRLEIDRHKESFQPVLMRSICDYIAGMTDSFAMNEYHNLYGHKCLQIK